MSRRPVIATYHGWVVVSPIPYTRAYPFGDEWIVGFYRTREDARTFARTDRWPCRVVRAISTVREVRQPAREASGR